MSPVKAMEKFFSWSRISGESSLRWGCRVRQRLWSDWTSSATGIDVRLPSIFSPLFRYSAVLRKSPALSIGKRHGLGPFVKPQQNAWDWVFRDGRQTREKKWKPTSL